MIEGILFDFDGVVAETMLDNFKAWNLAFKDFGVNIDSLDYYLLEGMGRYEIAELLALKYKVDIQYVKQIVEKKEFNYKKNNAFKYYKYIEDIFKFLKNNNVKIGLVTGASKSRINETLDEKMKLYFDAIVTVDDVSKGKPSPEPYLVGLKKLNTNLLNTIVIENAQIGIQSAKSAGMICYAIETTLDKNYLLESDIIFDNHKNLYIYIKNNLKNLIVL